MSLHFSNTDNWLTVYNQKSQANIITKKPLVYDPIPEFFTSLQLEARYVAIKAFSESAKPNWHTAGYVNQVVRTGLLTTGGDPDARVGSSSIILLNQIKVFETLPYSSTYSLAIYLHRWILDATITIWEYTGME